MDPEPCVLKQGPGGEVQLPRSEVPEVGPRGLAGITWEADPKWHAKTAGSLTLDTRQGQTEVMVSPSTKYKVPGVKNSALANVLVGSSVAVNGVWANRVYTARQVMVSSGKPEQAHRDNH